MPDYPPDLEIRPFLKTEHNPFELFHAECGICEKIVLETRQNLNDQGWVEHQVERTMFGTKYSDFYVACSECEASGQVKPIPKL